MPNASLNVPHFKQEFPYSCFAAAARMVLAFFGHQHTEVELRAAMSTGSGGTRARDLLGLATLGFEVQFATTDLAGLVAFLTSGQPPITLLATSSLPYWQQICNHVAVVVGVDDSWVYLNDPYFNSAPQQVSHSDFLLAWSPNACTVAIVQPRP
jgi:ABC-type bacteriocin/lantibiotic exporter with double-glycine peptidase domain